MNFQQCGMCDHQRLRPACAYAQSDQSLCLSLEYSLTVKLLTEHHSEFLSLTGGCTGLSDSTLVKCHIDGNHMPWLKFVFLISDSTEVPMGIPPIRKNCLHKCQLYADPKFKSDCILGNCVCRGENYQFLSCLREYYSSLKLLLIHHPQYSGTMLIFTILWAQKLY